MQAGATGPRRSQRKKDEQAEALYDVRFTKYNSKLGFSSHRKHKRSGALERVPLNMWELIAQQCSTFQDFWALSATCRPLHVLRAMPMFVSWRKTNARLTQHVDDVNVAICNGKRCCNELFDQMKEALIREQQLFDALRAEFYDDPAAARIPSSRGHLPEQWLDAVSSLAWASMQEAVEGNPTLQSVMGTNRTQSTDVSGPFDTAWAAFAEVDGGDVLEYAEICDKYTCLSRGTWIPLGVRALESVVQLLLAAAPSASSQKIRAGEAGLDVGAAAVRNLTGAGAAAAGASTDCCRAASLLDMQVPCMLPESGPAPPLFGRVSGAVYHDASVRWCAGLVPLWQWLSDHERWLGKDFVKALLQLYGEGHRV